MVKALHEKTSKVFAGFLFPKTEKISAKPTKVFSDKLKPAKDKSEYNLTYAEFVVPIFKTVQEQSKKMNAQEKLIHNYLNEIKQLRSIIENK